MATTRHGATEQEMVSCVATAKANDVGQRALRLRSARIGRPSGPSVPASPPDEQLP
jgi:hypothetical protein